MATQIRQQDNVTILEPSGRMVGPAVSELRQTILPDIEAAETPRILINFENVNMMDSAGLGALMEARAIAAHARMVVSGSSMSANTLKICLCSAESSVLFEHYDSEEEAISALST